MRKKTLCLDFDGVLNSYTSGWKGPRCIPDPPTEDALEFLDEALRHFDVAVLSSRSHYFGGRQAMKRWLHCHVCAAGAQQLPVEHWLVRRVSESHRMEPWECEVDRVARDMIVAIQWPKHKSPAHVSLDDRGWRFTGRWPAMSELEDFKPWNKRGSKESRLFERMRVLADTARGVGAFEVRVRTDEFCALVAELDSTSPVMRSPPGE